MKLRIKPDPKIKERMFNKKLIEVALPLDKINSESGREKSIRFGHPSTLHLWWARRPLAAARAVIWASLVDDPSSHPDVFPSEEEQNKERNRLFNILGNLVTWENANDENVLNEARKEITRSIGSNWPAFLDPFAGGGTIPYEAQRLGLKANAHDLNPVAVLINKAMLEIPPRFMGKRSVNPNDNRLLENIDVYNYLNGMAKDVQYYGNVLQEELKKKVGEYYPPVELPQSMGGTASTPIAWIWVRTIKCQNPACGCEMPLASSFVLSKKKGYEAWAEPVNENKNLRFKVHYGKCPKEKETVKVGKGASFRCCFCGAVADKQYIHDEFINKRVSYGMMAIVATTKNRRVFVTPTEEQMLAASRPEPAWMPMEDMNPNTPDLVSGRGYGITKWNELFTKRQLTTLTTLSDLIQNIQPKIEKQAVNAGFADDHISLNRGGSGALAYSQAVCMYLTFGLSRLTNISNAMCRWESSREQSLTLFSRQAIPMIWDFAENNPFACAAGDYTVSLGSIIRVLENFHNEVSGEAEQLDAQSDCGLRDIMVSMDPPYYDNIAYADLSDFFYIWLRKPLRDIYPDLLSTVLAPKSEELTAISSRFQGGSFEAKQHFGKGMLCACKQIYKYVRDDIPLTVYYAYKQSDVEADEEKGASSGWETMLTSIVKSGFSITGTWPVRTEMANRQIASGTNALASSIVLVCRKRAIDAPSTTRRNFVNLLHRELRPALRKLQQSNIAPVDLAQSAIGPGMGIFSSFKRVLEADGSEMSVRSALKTINEEIDLYFNEQVGDLDSASRFCIDLYTQTAYDKIKYGEAEVLANAKGTSIPMMASHGVLDAKAGTVHLIERNELPVEVDHGETNIWLLTQQLTQAMATGGIEKCAEIIAPMYGSNAERAKELAYRLYTIAEQKNWTQEAYAYNSLVVAWPDIQSRAAAIKAAVPKQLSLEFNNNQ